ncbi:MAG: hypothetical protein ACMXYL_01105 [Candidatus Woesearchaeota archaeon]
MGNRWLIFSIFFGVMVLICSGFIFGLDDDLSFLEYNFDNDLVSFDGLVNYAIGELYDDEHIGFINDISTCQVLSRPGSYFLSSNVNASGTCFKINVSDVVLDCKGHTIDYSSDEEGYGVLIWSQSLNINNVSVINCNVIQSNPNICSISNPCPSIYGLGKNSSPQRGVFGPSEPNSIIFYVDNVSLTNLNISTASSYSYGIHTGYTRFWNMSNLRVNTSGDSATGVHIQISRNHSLTDITVHTTGKHSAGFSIASVSRGIFAKRTEIVTLGDSATGYSSFLSYFLSLQDSRIKTMGNRSTGIALSDSSFEMHDVTVITYGNYSVAALGAGSIKNVNMTTFGDFSEGIRATGSWRVEDTNIHTSGVSSSGIMIPSGRHKSFSLSRSSIITVGNISSGINATSTLSLNLDEVNISTIGDRSEGMVVSYLRFECSLSKVNINTLGKQSRGFYLLITPYLSDSQICEITDSTINSKLSNDFDLLVSSPSGYVRLINTTFDHHNVSFFDPEYDIGSKHGWVDVGYWTDVYLKNIKGDPVGKSRIRWITINFRTIRLIQGNISTHEEGHARIPLISYSHHEEKRIPITFYVLIVNSPSGYFDIIILRNITNNRDIHHIFGLGIAKMIISATLIFLSVVLFVKKENKDNTRR